MGTVLVVDRGYITMTHIPDAGGAVLPSPLEICNGVGAEMIWRVLEGRNEYRFRYDQASHLLIKEEGNDDQTFAHNSARIATMIRYKM